jgi:hypothetical protein
LRFGGPWLALKADVDGAGERETAVFPPTSDRNDSGCVALDRVIAASPCTGCAEGKFILPRAAGS